MANSSARENTLGLASSRLANIPDPVIQQYKKRFDAIDLNKDGVISLREIATIGKVFGYRLSIHELGEIFGKRDLNDDGGITFDEFVVAMMDRARQNQLLAPLRETFRAWDVKSKGYITSDEALPILERELGFDLSKTEGLIDMFDKNRDYRISIKEFTEFYPKVQQLKAEIERNFQDFDINGDGYVDFMEAKDKMCSKGFTDDDIAAFFAKYDEDGDGRLNYTEFAKFWDIPLYT